MVAVSELRAHLRLPPTHDPADEEGQYLLALRTSAVAYLERSTGRYFGPLEEITRTVPGVGTTTLWLPDALATESDDAPYPESVSEYAYAGADATVIEAAGFAVTPPSRLIRTGGSAWTVGLLYGVTYWRGYVVGGLPDGEYADDPVAAAAAYPVTQEAYLIGAPGDAQHAVRLIVAHWYLSRLPILSGTSTEELPFSLRGIFDSNRYLFV